MSEHEPVPGEEVDDDRPDAEAHMAEGEFALREKEVEKALKKEEDQVGQEIRESNKNPELIDRK